MICSKDVAIARDAGDYTKIIVLKCGHLKKKKNLFLAGFLHDERPAHGYKENACNRCETKIARITRMEEKRNRSTSSRFFSFEIRIFYVRS